jgi:hypothetical protein
VPVPRPASVRDARDDTAAGRGHRRQVRQRHAKPSAGRLETPAPTQRICLVDGNDSVRLLRANDHADRLNRDTAGLF